MRAIEPEFELTDIAHLRNEKRSGADVAFGRLRCAEGADRSDCADRPELALWDNADPTHRGIEWLRAES